MRDAEAFDRHSTEALNLASAYIYSERKGEWQGERNWERNWERKC